MKKVPIKDIDYVILFAEKLKESPELFNNQKVFIEGQFRSSRDLFTKSFGKGDRFKLFARKYLAKRGIIKNDKI